MSRAIRRKLAWGNSRKAESNVSVPRRVCVLRPLTLIFGPGDYAASVGVAQPKYMLRKMIRMTRKIGVVPGSDSKRWPQL